MEKDYLGISSTVLVSLLFGLALVLVNSWFNQPTVEEVVPRSTYLMVMIALFFIDTVAFIFMQLYGNDSNLLIVFYVQIMPDDFVMQLHRF